MEVWFRLLLTWGGEWSRVKKVSGGGIGSFGGRHCGAAMEGSWTPGNRKWAEGRWEFSWLVVLGLRCESSSCGIQVPRRVWGL